MTTEAIDSPVAEPETKSPADVIRDLARAEDALFQAWVNDDSDETGETPPPVEYWTAFDEWLASYDARALPIAAREMADMDRAYSEWDASGENDPPKRFWLARQAANEACLREPPALEPLTSVADLVKQNVYPRQIARIWHLLLPDGEPDILRVEREINSPGSVITPEHIAHVDALRLAQLGFGPPPELDDEPDEPEPPAAVRPSIEQMIRDMANVEQIARAKSEEFGTQPGPWIELITAMASLMGIRLSANAQQTSNEGGRSFNESRYGKAFVDRGVDVQPVMPPSEITIKREGDDELAEAPVEAESSDSKIAQLFQDGHDIAAIAREVSLPVKKVKAAIRKWESEQMNAGSADGEEVQD